MSQWFGTEMIDASVKPLLKISLSMLSTLWPKMDTLEEFERSQWKSQVVVDCSSDALLRIFKRAIPSRKNGQRQGADAQTGFV